jgi:predicted lipoprotein with Yx(FWY)xxD motif
MSTSSIQLEHNGPTGPRRLRKGLVLAAGAAAVALTVAACGSSSSGGSGAGATPPASSPAAAAAALKTGSTPDGTVLVDSTGRTVYVFANDAMGKSNCSGTCLQYWQPVVASAMPEAGTGVTAHLGVITRSDGTKQLTVKGWPVYTYTGDSASGEANGQGVTLNGGLWWVVSPSGAWIKTKASAKPSSSSSGGGGGWA